MNAHAHVCSSTWIFIIILCFEYFTPFNYQTAIGVVTFEGCRLNLDTCLCFIVVLCILRKSLSGICF